MLAGRVALAAPEDQPKAAAAARLAVLPGHRVRAETMVLMDRPAIMRGALFSEAD